MALPDASRVSPQPNILKRPWRQARLRKHGDFEKVYGSGRRLFSAHMTFFFLPRDGASTAPRVGFTLARALGGAVQRNRMRRRVREAVRLNLQLLSVAVDVVIHPKKSVLTAEFAELQQEVAAAFGKIQARIATSTRNSEA
jgi:ribonuclease P protein component